MAYSKRFVIPLEEPFSLEYARTTYTIYPWIAESRSLIRMLRLPSAIPVLVEISEGEGCLDCLAVADHRLSARETAWISNTMTWALSVSEPYAVLGKWAKKDPILRAALRVNKGIRAKRYTDVFEALCGAICAQNVDFRRLYQMMQGLAMALGPGIDYRGNNYHAFPLASEVASSTEATLRSCKVGYRAKTLKKAATFVTEQPRVLDRDALARLPIEAATEQLSSIPGIGPYSARIILKTGVGRHDAFQLDSFTREILKTFYFGGKAQPDTVLATFVTERWGQEAGKVAGLLTTNTDTWAELLGVKGFRRSFARVSPPAGSRK